MRERGREDQREKGGREDQRACVEGYSKIHLIMYLHFIYTICVFLVDQYLP